MRPILEVATELGIEPARVETLGAHKAKIDPNAGEGRDEAPLVVVSAITPTRAGEGKTTVSVGLGDAMRRIGRRPVVCIREPSIGPVFGAKGGGTGGGRAQVVPADDINLHFTGDLHAITSAHNLLAAMIDNDLHFGASSGLDRDAVSWPRVLDVGDRALRRVIVGSGTKTERASRFDITAASEVMAMLALAGGFEDLRARLLRTVVGWRSDGGAVKVADLDATDAMLALLRDALRPNLVQTIEGTPALVHCGPFANIAHGCSSVLATRLAARHADVVITEAGFGFDLGGEKLLQIKCRASGLWPHCVVLVVTVRALVAHGGGEGHDPLRVGLAHLDRQLDNVRAFGLPAVVAINVFADDSEAALGAIESWCAETGVAVARCTSFVDGGAGGEALALRVVSLLDRPVPASRYLYELDAPYLDKVRAVATTLYGAADVAITAEARAELDRFVAAGFDALPVCIAKTHLSFSDDPAAGGLARGFVPTVTSARLAAGAGYVVALMGNIRTMPAMPRDAAARHVRVDAAGRVRGLMQGE